jgi:DNA-binding MltR family transcriptional regulator
MSDNLAAEISRLVGVLSLESARGLVLAGAACRDSCLKALLEASFIEDTEIIYAFLDSDGPLSTFSSRMKLTYLLGLLEADEY